jgi:hypothetical protein
MGLKCPSPQEATLTAWGTSLPLSLQCSFAPQAGPVQKSFLKSPYQCLGLQAVAPPFYRYEAFLSRGPLLHQERPTHGE